MLGTSCKQNVKLTLNTHEVVQQLNCWYLPSKPEKEPKGTGKDNQTGC